MTDANYIRHFKVLGKLAYLYDTAGSNATALQTLLAVFADQVADGTYLTVPAVKLFNNTITEWDAAIGTAGSLTTLRSMAVNAGRAYITNATFTAGLTTTPASASVADVLAALQTEMGAGVDDKTLSTEAATGLVNFLDTLLGSEGTWNTAEDASADYKDSVYVVAALVE